MYSCNIQIHLLPQLLSSPLSPPYWWSLYHLLPSNVSHPLKDHHSGFFFAPQNNLNELLLTLSAFPNSILLAFTFILDLYTSILIQPPQIKPVAHFHCTSLWIHWDEEIHQTLNSNDCVVRPISPWVFLDPCGLGWWQLPVSSCAHATP